MELKITENGQLTLDPALLRHLGLKKGDTVDVDPRPDGSIALRAHREPGTRNIRALRGLLHRPGMKAASLEEIEKATQEGWAGIPENGRDGSDTRS
ncbi:AbrB/MazE/SpoVT family DNA-binding domain-containing protein [Caenispirillum salinarum]|uniref:AbrB/MazE/SpoVT family DNA-binding domain-containing protein n=1 Tax=Caenispirillum salinarum TaxID=859058 RepID=UPI00068BFD3C|nr:AbrB/MazE/SpoVT family DNA-binding domain-containing protein [Caenispirillum salinarum]